MRRLILMVAAIAVSLPLAQQAHAWGGFWRKIEVDFNRNNCWPEPFVQADRAAVRDTFAVMVANGWQQQHTMDGYHFDAETQQLTQQGRQKLHWILTQTPPDRRTVFVLAATDSEITRSRIDAVQQHSASLVQQGSLPQVMVTSSAPRGRSAARVDAMNVQAHDAIPVPVLPEMQAAGGGSQ